MDRSATPQPRRADGWITGPQRRTAPAVRLFCLPYAGGAASAYARWPASFGGEVEVCGVELPGRQSRFGEQPFTRMGMLVDALASAVEPELKLPYALFGHSMGSLVAFELARELHRRGIPGPRVLFVSGGPAPQSRQARPRVHDRSDAIVIDRMRSLGGLSEEILAETELLELLLPTIRADFELLDTYAYRPGPPLACPVVAFSGTEDQAVPAARVEAWHEQTSAAFTHHELPGGHFFLRSAQEPLLQRVRASLAEACAPGDPHNGPERGHTPA
ncbi:alpha/beta fold hydrolase [Streptomyces sp. NBC_01341]|uniref:thioesterase II family protein n=1 Tax=Streptomyces sp. NBC_01341 TaxID=2903831 RepID=UPI002E15B783|nr:alpha/beta fold hydrolase [Streptomyces sp. NBC_01341]